MIRFQLLAEDGAARRGRLETPRGTVETPVFMPVGTAGTREDAGAARPRRARRRDRSSATPTTCTCAPATSGSGGWAGCTASCPGRAPCSPTRAASRSTACRGRPAQAGRLAGADRRGGGHLPQPPRRLAPLPLAGDRPSAIQLDLGRRRDHGLRRVPAGEGRAGLPRAVAGPDPALARALPGRLARAPSRRTASGPRSSASPRAASSPTCAGGPSRRRAALDLPGYALGGYAVGEEPAGDVGRGGAPRPAAAPGEAPLPHGRGHARGPAGRDRRRDRHVRLRPPHPHAPATASSSPAGGGST